MTKDEFLEKLAAVKNAMPDEELKRTVKGRVRGKKDLLIALGELNELAIEILYDLRGSSKMDPANLLQELSHVQWAVWTIQELYGVSDEDLNKAIEASFR